MQPGASDILAMMPLSGLLAILVVVAVVVALATNRVAAETAMLAGLLAQILIGAVDPASALAGFAHPAVVAIGALFVVAAGLFETGASAALANRLLGRPRSVRGAQLRLIVPVTLLSAFINNTPVVAMYLPIVRDWAKRIRVSPSKLLMPLSFSSILGGQLTLVGSASNLIVMGLYVKYLTDSGLATPSPQLQFWGPALLGLPLAGVGLAYLVSASPGLLPERQPLADEWDSARRYTVQMDVLPDSPAAGATIESAGLRSLPGLFLFEIERGGLVIPAPGPETTLRAGDRLGFTGVLDSVVDLQRVRGLAPTQHHQDDVGAPSADRELVEAVIPARSPLAGKSVPERLRQPARSVAQIDGASAPLRHQVQAEHGLQGADEDGGGIAPGARHHVGAVVDAVGDVDVQGAGGSEHGVVAPGPALRGVRVAGGVVASKVGLGLDDDAGCRPPFHGGVKGGPQEPAGGRRRIPGEEMLQTGDQASALGAVRRS